MSAPNNLARDAVFARTTQWLYVIVTREIPLCPTHQVQMVQYSGGKSKTRTLRYYGCPVEGCECQGKGRTSKKYCC
jgi:hypothetical protein